jgi:tRNA threonylcarbamoyladenosine biosynthesis protein TsaB
MAIILNIDTAVETGSVSLAKSGVQLTTIVNDNQKDHASWIQPAIKKLIAEGGFKLKELEGVAVAMGPGSYTGLRVGLATAKGLCFALGIPLIGLSTLEVMVQSVISEEAEFYCPLIDARRMEVYTAVFDKSLLQIVKPHAAIIDENSFDTFLQKGKTIFLGNGKNKLRGVLSHANALYSNVMSTSREMVALSEEKFLKKEFQDLAYSEPFYLKEFYSPSR